MAEGTQQHWRAVWSAGDGSDRSWFQLAADRSLHTIQSVCRPPARVIDVGGGSSVLVDQLLAAGYVRPTVLDIADEALQHSRTRLGEMAGQVDWVAQEVTTLELGRPFDVWHDRAVLHFLTNEQDQRAYVAALERHIPVGGHAVIATFSPNGPTTCSNLPVQQYDVNGLHVLLGPSWTLVTADVHVHVTPTGAEQEFTWAILRRVGD